MADEKKELNMEELGEAAGGFFPGPAPAPFPPFPAPYPAPQPYIPPQRPALIGTCNRCAEMGFMNNNLYKVFNSDIAFCLDEGHIFHGGAFDHTNKDEAKGYMGI